MKKQLDIIARVAGRMILDRPGFQVETKEGHANFVTTIDCKVQTYLDMALPGLLPGSVVIGEEKENRKLTDAPTWIVDPVDGTTNMIHDCRCSAVSIALLQEKKPVAGIIYQPYTDEMFYAEAGKGATLNERPIHVSQTPFHEALVAIGTSPYHEELAEKSMKLALSCLRSCADIRRSGSAAVDLAWVACGRVDAFMEYNLKPWDYAAGALIVREAGGCFMTPPGEDTDYGINNPVLAVNDVCREQMLALFLENE